MHYLHNNFPHLTTVGCIRRCLTFSVLVLRLLSFKIKKPCFRMFHLYSFSPISNLVPGSTYFQNNLPISTLHIQNGLVSKFRFPALSVHQISYLVPLNIKFSAFYYFYCTSSSIKKTFVTSNPICNPLSKFQKSVFPKDQINNHLSTPPPRK